MSEKSFFILTGRRGSGKTSLCTRVFEEARKRGLDTAGIFCPAVFKDGQKIGISARDARSGETRLLAGKIRRQGSESGLKRGFRLEAEELPSGIQTKIWDFDESVLEWGNSVFSCACPCDLLFVDEIGPLELEKGQGWMDALDALRSRLYRSCILVIRPELVARAQELFPASQLVDLEQGIPEPGYFLVALMAGTL